MNRTTTNLKTYNKRMREVYERIGEIYLDQSYYGSRQMTAVWKRLGDEVNRKRVQRLLKKMCIVAIYARKRTTIRAKSYTIYPSSVEKSSHRNCESGLVFGYYILWLL